MTTPGIPGTRAAPYAPFTTVAANADIDIWLPGSGRTVPSIPAYLANNAVLNVGDFYSTTGILPADGTTSIATAITTALTAAIANGGGVVRLPWTALGYNIGAASPGITVPSNVTLECENGALFFNYPGTGIAIDVLGVQYTTLRNIYVRCSNDAASGVRFGGSSMTPSRWCVMDNVTAEGTGNLTTTGTAFILDSGPQFCAYLRGKAYGLGFKYGLDVIGQSVGAHTWTAVSLDLVLVGRGAGVVTGSRGIRTDANSNLEASTLPNVIIEGFEQSYEFANGSGCLGFTLHGAGIEGNTTNTPTPPASYNGAIEDFHADWQYRQTTNALLNIWMREFIHGGIWLTETFYDRLHAIYDGNADARAWGVQRGGSPIGGQYATDKFIVSTGDQNDVGVLRNFYKFLEYKTSFSNAAPIVGSWGKGSVIWNTVPAAGVPLFWVCDSSGTLKSSPGNTAITTSGSPTVTVSGLSTLEKNDYITIAGAYASPARIKSINGLTLTMESNASGSVSAIAVVFPVPTFNIVCASKASAVADVGTLATTETASGSYTSTEQSMLNHLKADVTALRATVNTLLAARRTALEQA